MNSSVFIFIPSQYDSIIRTYEKIEGWLVNKYRFTIKKKIISSCDDLKPNWYDACRESTVAIIIVGDLIASYLKQDQSLLNELSGKDIVVIGTIMGVQELFHPNYFHCSAPSISVQSRIVAQYASLFLDRSKTGIVYQVIAVEDALANCEYIRLAKLVFKNFVVAMGVDYDKRVKVVSRTSDIPEYGKDCLFYIVGMATSRFSETIRAISKTSQTNIIVDRSFINVNAIDGCYKNINYFDSIDRDRKNSGEYYASSIQEVFNLLKVCKDSCLQNETLKDVLANKYYYQMKYGEGIYLISELGQLVSPIFLRGQDFDFCPKSYFCSDDVVNIVDEAIAELLQITDERLKSVSEDMMSSYLTDGDSVLNFKVLMPLAEKILQIVNGRMLALVAFGTGKIDGAFFHKFAPCQNHDENLEWNRVDFIVQKLLSLTVMPIQLNLLQRLHPSCDDLENNNTIRIFVEFYGDDGESVILPLQIFRDSMAYDLKKVLRLILCRTLEGALSYSRSSRERQKWLYKQGIRSVENDADDFELFLANLIYVFDSSRRCGFTALYFLPTQYVKTNALGGEFIGCMTLGIGNGDQVGKLSYINLRLLMMVANRVFDRIFNALRKYQLNISNVKSAIGSIMSRNGSHNIGSHVLAALSHNVGTMPDDRMLYQYIQHRMDYIATSTTDMPTWTSAAKVTLGAIKTFLSQRHLLDYIAGSEGLHGYKFQDPNLIDEKIMEQKDAIRLHVIRRIDNQDIPLLPYKFGSAKKDCDGLASIEEARSNCNKFDVEAAFPGGIVGQHALFNILENIIRNAAKHGWAMMDKTRRGAFLDVYLRIEDDTSDSNLRITVFDGLSNIKEINGRNGGDIIGDTNRKLNEPFITKSGSLRRENWGLAEMRMSAGYLQRREIGEIGGIISLRKRPNVSDDFIIRAVNADNHIGYQFLLPKPREILIMVRSHDVQGIDVGRLQSLRACGIYVEVNDAREIATEKASNYDYKFVVLPQFEVKQKNPFLPFRVMVKCFSDRGKEVNDGPILIPALHEKYDELINEFKSSATNAEIAKNIKGIVCKRWIDYWCKDRRSLGYIPEIIVQPEDSGRATNGQKRSEQCLIKDVDVWKVVFGEVFHSLAGEGEAVTSKYGENAEEEAFYEFLLLIVSLPERKAMGFCNDEELSLRSSQKRWVIVHQLLDWYDKWADQLQNEDFCKEINARAKDFILQYPSFCHCIVDNEGDNKGKRNLCIDFNDINTKTEIREFANRLRTWGADGMFEFDTDAGTEIAKYNGFVTFVSELEGAFLQTHVMIRKYEERIVTLPQSFAPRKKGSNDVVSKQGDLGLQCEDVGIKLVFVNSTTDHAHAGRSIDYRRHYGVDDFKLNIEHMLYAEPLSGTQGYLNAILSMREMENAGMFATGLIENALVRLLIVDERAADFLREHPTQTKVFSMMGIWVVDDKNMGESKSNDESLPKVTTLDEKLPLLDKHIILDRRVFQAVLKVLKGMKVGQNYSWKLERLRGLLRNHVKDWFDILIIHQGLIDKWFPGASSDKMQVELFIEFLKRVFPYVVITTGRGTPANIPASARILPFSIIENTLFKNSPEKMILIDTVMRVLPTGDHT